MGANAQAGAAASEAGNSATLSPAEWQFASTQRAGLYGWFSRLYAEEVSDEMFRSHFADGGFAPFAGLAELGLGAEVQRLDAAIAALRAEALPRLELAADFAQLFLLDGKTSALPYASAYEGKEAASPLYGAAEARMRDFLAARALAIQAGFREPADHLAVPLALMAELAGKDAAAGDIPAAAAAQAGFIHAGLVDCCRVSSSAASKPGRASTSIQRWRPCCLGSCARMRRFWRMLAEARQSPECRRTRRRRRSGRPPPLA